MDGLLTPPTLRQRRSLSPALSFVLDSNRRPEFQSDGNYEMSGLSGVESYHTSPLSLASSMPSAVPTPVMTARTMASGCGPASLPPPSGSSINPIYFNRQFQQYREKQARKTTGESKDQKWPSVLEDAFLDALLLLPNMGRQKYSMRGGLHGRNMLILEYIWIAYCMSLLPGQVPEKSFRRTRKQVSSHIQVIKSFYKYCKYYHFLFSREDNEKDRTKGKGRRGSKKHEDEEEGSIKQNTILMAISEGRLPDERLNYDYFAHLLTADSRVALYPRTVWLYVSNPAVRLAEGGDAYHSSGQKLEARCYPHIDKNFDADGDVERLLNGKVLLHEYARDTAQEECSSGTVKEAAEEWKADFPAIYDALLRCTQTDDCEIFELTVRMELPGQFPYPSGSQLNASVELGISEPSLQTHEWKCITRLVRPMGLCRDGEAALVQQVNLVTAKAHPRREKAADDSCGCGSHHGHDVHVPFPAALWTSMLARCAEFPDDAVPKRRRATRSGDAVAAERSPTATDMLSRVAMLQEVWSRPSTAAGEAAWTRRAVLLWRFQTCSGRGFDKTAKGSKKSAARSELPGTSWRFLTALDPASPQHQQTAYVNTRPAGVGSRVLPRELLEMPRRDSGRMVTGPVTGSFEETRSGGLHSGYPPLLRDRRSLSVFGDSQTDLGTPPLSQEEVLSFLPTQPAPTLVASAYPLHGLRAPGYIPMDPMLSVAGDVTLFSTAASDDGRWGAPDYMESQGPWNAHHMECDDELSLWQLKKTTHSLPLWSEDGGGEPVWPGFGTGHDEDNVGGWSQFFAASGCHGRGADWQAAPWTRAAEVGGFALMEDAELGPVPERGVKREREEEL